MKQDSYVTKLLAMIESGELQQGRLSHVETRHDDWCAFLVQGGVCDCDPEIVITHVEEEP